MPSDLERRLRDARPALPEPGGEITARARAALLERRRSRGVGAARWAGGRPARLLILAALLAAAGGALAATLLPGGTSGAAAAPPLRWGPPELLSGRFATFASPAVAVSGNGDAVLAWLQGARLDARLHPAAGGWTAPQTLSSTRAVASGPAAAMDARGGAIVVWRERRAERVVTRRLRFASGAPAGVLRARAGESYVVVARRRPPGGMWGPLKELSMPSRTRSDGAEPQLAIARDGMALAAWPMGRWVVVRSRLPGRGWSAPTRLDAGGAPVQVRLALDPSGAAALVWSARRRNSSTQGPLQHYVVRAALRPARGTWQAPLDVSGRLRFAPGDAVIAVDDRLRAAVAWGDVGEPLPGGDTSRVEGAVRLVDGRWSAPRALDPHAPAPPPGSLLWPKATVRLDADGTAVVVFNRVTGPAFATMATDGTLSPSRPLAGRRTGWESLQPDGAGGLVLVLRAPRGLALRSWRPGPRWTPARILPGSSKAYASALGAGPGGAILAWVQFRGTGATPLQIRVALGRKPARREGP
jgi:hypothetical protein